MNQPARKFDPANLMPPPQPVMLATQADLQELGVFLAQQLRSQSDRIDQAQRSIDRIVEILRAASASLEHRNAGTAGEETA